MTQFKRFQTPLLLLVFGVAALLTGGAAYSTTAQSVDRPQEALAPYDYVQSTTCQTCHPDHYDSWHQTYHRTMTQVAAAEAVVGDFDDAAYTYQGVTSRFLTRNGRYFIQTQATDGNQYQFEVVFTVGSRRIQQYITRVGDSHWRLPLAWDIEEGRWFHLNGGFLDPDDTPFNAHLGIWDANCIFCHNTKPRPNMSPLDASIFDPEVAEYGIACEACHGPAEAHVRDNINPLRRYALYLNEAWRDPTLISPNELSPTGQAQVCGRCHGQRVVSPPELTSVVLMEGDPYTVGEDLGQYYQPIFQHTKLEGVDLALRFWEDGTPRLTAYEYQGLLMSNHEGTDLTCTSCHNMHGGDPKGMIDEVMRGDLACTQCHTEIEEDVAAHTGHEVASSGSRCYSCHMPRTTYGVKQIHPSHRITNPDPSRAWVSNMPEACTLCHTNRSAAWAAVEFTAIYGTPVGEAPAGDAWQTAENVRALLSGDVVQRSVAAMAFADVNEYADAPEALLWAAPFLIVTMERDTYAAIRHFAQRSLETLVAEAGLSGPAAVVSYDYLGTAAERAPATDAWWAWWAELDKSDLVHPGDAVPLDAAFMPQMESVAALLARQDNRAISIGE